MKNKQGFLEALHESILIGDGAIGTALFARGVVPERGVERMNLLAPQKVLDLHADYVKAGSQVIETNTFGANILNLAKYGVESEKEVRTIIHSGVKLARTAADNKAYVAGSIGPLPIIDGEPLSISDETAIFTAHITALIEAGVDTLIFESFTSPDEIFRAVATARNISDIPIIAQASFGQDKRTSNGACAEEIALGCLKAGANVIGANCGFGISSTVGAVEQMASTGAPLSAFLNAGFPERFEDRLVYDTSSEYFVNAALRLVEIGARLIGGCCGTNPDMIKQIAQHIPQSKSFVSYAPTVELVSPEQFEPAKTQNKQYPGFNIIVELDPPKDLNLDTLIDTAKTLAKVGVSAISVSDNPFASIRIDNLTVAGAVLRETGLPVILHMTGRDRNRIALQSTIMGAHVTGIRSILCVTGDPIRMCEEPNTSGVFDLTSVGLAKMVSDFNNGHKAAGDCKTAFSIGVGINPNVRTISGQIDKLKRKIDAGAGYVLTQPVFEISKIDALKEAIEKAGIKIPIYIGIMPLLSSRHAEFMHNEIPGIQIPADIRAKLASYEVVSDQRKAGMEITIDFVKQTVNKATGFYFICPRNKANTVIPLIQAAHDSFVLK